MSSAFWSELAKLDDNLQSIQSQVDWIHAGLEFDGDRLKEGLTEAGRHGAAIRDLIRAERSDAGWSDRTALERLIHELEIAAQERRNQQRRTKLMELAGELEAGAVRHRLEARTATLTKLRQEAIKQLRTEAALADQVKDLPGPRASQWVVWACGLQEEKDGFALSRLRKDFSALDRFVAAMEASYWLPGSAVRATSSQTSAPATRPTPASGYPKPPQNVRPPERVATRSGSNGEALSVPDYTPLTETPRSTEPAKQSPTATATVSKDATKPPPPRLNYCDQCGSSYRGDFHICPVDRSVTEATAAAATREASFSREQGGNGVAAVAPARDARAHATSEAAVTSEEPAADLSPEAAGSEFERLKALVGDSYPVADDEIAASPYQQFLGNKRMLAITGAAVVVLLGGIFAVIHHFTSGRSSPPASPPQTVSAKVPDVTPDADIQKSIEQKLTALKGSSIQVAVQEGVVTLTGKTPAKADLAKAESLAAEVAGVKQVTDKVQVEAGKGRRH